MLNVINKLKGTIKNELFFPVLIGLILSTLLISYAISSILLGAFVFFVFLNFLDRKKVELQRELILPVVLYIVFVASYTWSVDTELTIKGLGKMASLLVVPLAFISLPKFSIKQTFKSLEIFSKINILYGILFLGSSTLQFLSSNSLREFTYHDLVSVLDLNAIYVSSYFLISFIYFLSKKEKSIIDIIAACFLFILILLLSSKMAILILITYLLIKTIRLIKNFDVKTALIVSSAFLIMVIIALSFKQVGNRYFDEAKTDIKEILRKDNFGQAYIWTGTSIRLLQLRILKDQLKEESIALKGFGLFASRENLRDRHIKYKTYYGYHNYNYHNQYAQTLAELGLIGLLILLGMFYLIIRKSIQSKNELFTFFCLSMLFIFATESFMWRQRGLFLFIILYCLLNRTIFNAIPLTSKHE